MVTLPSYAAAQLLGHSHPIGTGSSDGAGAGAGDSQPPAVGTSAAVLPEAADLSSIVCPPVAAVVLAYPDSAFKVVLAYPDSAGAGVACHGLRCLSIPASGLYTLIYYWSLFGRSPSRDLAT